MSMYFMDGYRSMKSTQKAIPVATASGMRVFKVLLIMKNNAGARIARSVATDFDFIVSSHTLNSLEAERRVDAAARGSQR